MANRTLQTTVSHPSSVVCCYLLPSYVAKCSSLPRCAALLHRAVPVRPPSQSLPSSCLYPHPDVVSGLADVARSHCGAGQDRSCWVRERRREAEREAEAIVGSGNSAHRCHLHADPSVTTWPLDADHSMPVGTALEPQRQRSSGGGEGTPGRGLPEPDGQSWPRSASAGDAPFT